METKSAFRRKKTKKRSHDRRTTFFFWCTTLGLPPTEKREIGYFGFGKWGICSLEKFRKACSESKNPTKSLLTHFWLFWIFWISSPVPERGGSKFHSQHTEIFVVVNKTKTRKSTTDDNQQHKKRETSVKTNYVFGRG